MKAYDSYLRVQVECNTLKEVCTNYTLKINDSSMLGSFINNYLKENREIILKECAKQMLRYRDRLLIDSKDELESLLKHISDIIKEETKKEETKKEDTNLGKVP